jgi:hypothetical protein
VAYPVVVEVLLPAVERVWYRRCRRDPADVPLARPGCAYVFKVNGEHVCYDTQHLDFADQAVVKATSVCLVDTRPRRLAVDITIPSALPDEDFTVRSTFRCRVVDAAAVADAGLTDLDVVLASYLASDDALGSVGRQMDVGRAHGVRRLADVRVRALCAVAPPAVSGVDVTLVHVELFSASPAAEPAAGAGAEPGTEPAAETAAGARAGRGAGPGRGWDMAGTPTGAWRGKTYRMGDGHGE